MIDVWQKREEITIIEAGQHKRKSNDQVYESNPRLFEHREYLKWVLLACRARSRVLWVLHTRQTVKEIIQEARRAQDQALKCIACLRKCVLEEGQDKFSFCTTAKRLYEKQ